MFPSSILFWRPPSWSRRYTIYWTREIEPLIHSFRAYLIAQSCTSHIHDGETKIDLLHIWEMISNALGLWIHKKKKWKGMGPRFWCYPKEREMRLWSKTLEGVILEVMGWSHRIKSLWTREWSNLTVMCPGIFSCLSMYISLFVAWYQPSPSIP